MSAVWPVLPGSERPPIGWPGWPNGKRMAFVLTHDIEGPEGLARVRQMAELEMSLGCRSSFNFIPEGPYRVPPELRAWLSGNGFEVGVHDLHHDGLLYTSREGFREKAKKINRYLKEWDATGFRAGFMFHNLEWQHDLDVLYDASTFDTDPFEPQPDGVGTIFPFWVRHEREPGALDGGQNPDYEKAPGGYVELPYTLPQDSSLFLLFRERTISTWQQKLGWVASHGGMALVNVHPDTLRYPGEPQHQRRVTSELYSDFLRHARECYGQEFWHVLPRELAAWVHESRSPDCPFMLKK